MDTQKIEEVRSQFIADLEDQAWRKECNAAFDETRIPIVIAERTKVLDEVVELSKPLTEIEKELKSLKNDNDKASIKQKKALKFKIVELLGQKDEKGVTLQSKINKANEHADDCEDTITAITNGVRGARQEAKGLRERIEFAKGYDINAVKTEDKIDENQAN